MSPVESVEELVNLGFSEREAKLYLALLEKDETSASALHRATGLPQSKAYTILGTMVAKGFCSERKSGNKRYFRAIRPSVLLDSLNTTWEQDFVSRKSTAEQTLSRLDKTYKNHNNNSRDFVEMILNRSHIHRRYLELVRNSKEEIMVFNRPPFAASTEKMRQEQYREQDRAFERGVLIRSIHQVTSRKQLEKDYLENNPVLHKNDKMKWIEELPMKLFIFDHKLVMMAMPTTMLETSVDFTMVIIDDPGYSKFCSRSFETYWEQANDFPNQKKKR